MEKSISDYIGCELIVVRKNLLKRIYELKYKDEVLCMLKIHNPITLKALATGFGNEDVEFYKSSLWSREICIKYSNNELPFANYKKPLFGLSGIIFLPRGEQLSVEYDLLGLNYKLNDGFGQTLITMKCNLFIPKARIEINSKSIILDKNSWLIPFLFYLMLKRRNR